LTKYCYIPQACRQLAQESTTNQVKTVILQQRYQVCFHKQADKMNHRALVAVAAEMKVSSLGRLIKNHCKILKLLQFANFSSYNLIF